MADPKIRIKRSSVAGKIPTPDQVPLGELALNTYDGKLFASKNVGIGTTVIAVNPWSVGVGTDSYNTYFTEGSVGIGTTLPTSKLDVVGDAKVSGVVTATSFSGDGGGLTGIPKDFTAYTAGIATSKSVGINTTNLDDPDLTGIGNSFQGLYVGNGMIIVDNVLNGNHYIGTNFNGLMAGPVTINGSLTIDGNYVVV